MPESLRSLARRLLFERQPLPDDVVFLREYLAAPAPDRAQKEQLRALKVTYEER